VTSVLFKARSSAEYTTNEYTIKAMVEVQPGNRQRVIHRRRTRNVRTETYQTMYCGNPRTRNFGAQSEFTKRIINAKKTVNAAQVSARVIHE